MFSLYEKYSIKKLTRILTVSAEVLAVFKFLKNTVEKVINFSHQHMVATKLVITNKQLCWWCSYLSTFHLIEDSISIFVGKEVFFATIHNLRIEQTFLVIMNQILMHLLIWENYDTNIRNTRLHNGTSMRIQHKGAKPEFYMADISPSASCSTKACLSHAYLYVNR